MISVIGQGLPREFKQLIDLGLNQNNEEALKLQGALAEGMDLIFEEGNPAGIKSIFEILGLSNAVVRLPLIEATIGLKQKITAFVKPFIKVTA